jgi:fluoride ion exporter CrcB/FEX
MPSSFATQLYTISYLILFSILGTLARVGLQWLTFYPGAPVVLGVLWANFAGSLIIGFLLVDWKLFGEGWGRAASPVSTLENVQQELLNVKKTVPLYIGLTTGFCGSLTSFSSFMRDAFLSLSNNLPTPSNHPYPAGFITPSPFSTVHRNAGYSLLSLLAVILLNICLSISALKIGGHLAIFLNPAIPTLKFSFTRKYVDPVIVAIAWLAWLGALIMTIFPPDRPGGPDAKSSWASEIWRGDAILACLFAPLGCLLRFFVSLRLNGISPYFPLGTFTVNIFGTAVLGMAYDLEHVPLGQGYNSGVGGGLVGCQVLQGIADGFCGCLTTVSTWVAEMEAMGKGRAYIYGIASVAGGLAVLVVVMGSVRWGMGWDQAVCGPYAP